MVMASKNAGALLLLVAMFAVWSCGYRDNEICAMEGESTTILVGEFVYAASENRRPCCAGLTKIAPIEDPDGGECSTDWVGNPLCTYCGDGECVPPENVCNCEQDCQE